MLKAALPVIILLIVCSLAACDKNKEQVDKLYDEWVMDIKGTLAHHNALQNLNEEDTKLARALFRAAVGYNRININPRKKMMIIKHNDNYDFKEFTVEEVKGNTIILKSGEETYTIEFIDDYTILFDNSAVYHRQ